METATEVQKNINSLLTAEDPILGFLCLGAMHKILGMPNSMPKGYPEEYHGDYREGFRTGYDPDNHSQTIEGLLNLTEKLLIEEKL